MPPLDGAAYLIGYLHEVGPALYGSMGAGPLTYGELDSWCGLAGIELQPWESRFLCRLSREYLSESQKAEKRDCPAPWQPAGAKPEVSSTQRALRNLANL